MLNFFFKLGYVVGLKTHKLNRNLFIRLKISSCGNTNKINKNRKIGSE